jgi:hypothetical protein
MATQRFYRYADSDPSRSPALGDRTSLIRDVKQGARVRDDPASRRAGAGSHDERARRADLPIHELRLRQLRGTLLSSDRLCAYITAKQHGADLFGLRKAGNIYSRIGNPTWVRLSVLFPRQWS